ncbi:MAG: hypothetical protein WCJ74_01495 [bacterium]
MQNLPSIQELASRARDIAKLHNIPMLDAIRSVAEEYGATSTIIAKELSRRGVLAKKKKRVQKLLAEEVQRRIRGTKPKAEKAKERKKKKEKIDPEDAERDWALTLQLKRRNLGCALHHEREMRKGFMLADHLDDY